MKHGLTRFCAVTLAAACTCLCGADWPTYRGDRARSGYTPEELPSELSLRWAYRSHHAPRPAWSGRDTRMPFDAVSQPIVAGGTLFLPTSIKRRMEEQPKALLLSWPGPGGQRDEEEDHAGDDEGDEEAVQVQ